MKYAAIYSVHRAIKNPVPLLRTVIGRPEVYFIQRNIKKNVYSKYNACKTLL